ncbi:HEPN domain-containing protein [Sphingomonas panacisoli]|uniref:HEPN domain-containing protein n=1 Tax=Sphingomonas panacisoli TaxID=1813879 RepID=UPI001F015BCE|nr:HEPN domain-containing protein [Sphingomonas panacisoli]
MYELPGSALATPQALTSADAYEMASRYFSGKLADLDRWIKTAEIQLELSSDDQGFRKLAAFNLHQATETAYACYLLTRTLYFPRSHNIKFLRSISEDKNGRLISAWQRSNREERRRFELLKRAYVEARYSDQYEISESDLSWLADSVLRLRDAVEAICRERLSELRTAAGLQSPMT